jgi:hypothetical protein
VPRFTELVLEIFRLNGVLLTQGDRLVDDIGLTSARWQVMGAAALSPVPGADSATADLSVRAQRARPRRRGGVPLDDAPSPCGRGLHV